MFLLWTRQYERTCDGGFRNATSEIVGQVVRCLIPSERPVSVNDGVRTEKAL